MFSTNALKVARFISQDFVTDESKLMVINYIRQNVPTTNVKTGGSWGGKTAFLKFSKKYNDSDKKRRAFPSLFGIEFVVNSGLDASHVVPCSAGGNLTAENLYLENETENRDRGNEMNDAEKNALRQIPVELPWDLDELN
jgi:hypothetical protein